MWTNCKTVRTTHDFYADALYDSLMKLCDGHDAFVYKDQVVSFDKKLVVDSNEISASEVKRFRIFGYNYAEKSDFDSAGEVSLNCRGTTFDITDIKNPKLISLPLMKFFNFGEYDQLSYNDLDKNYIAYEKLDGSMVSSYIVDGDIYLKTKMSFTSEQAIAAMNVLHNGSFENECLKHIIRGFELKGCTVIMEYTAPNNQIVINYDEPKLRIIGVRDKSNPNLISIPEYDKHIIESIESFMYRDNDLVEYYSDVLDLYNELTPSPFTGNASDINSMKDIEGFVFYNFERNKAIKMKTEEYVLLHKTRDNTLSHKNLWRLIYDKQADDVIALFKQKSLLSSAFVVQRCSDLFKDLVKKVKYSCLSFHSQNKSLCRKEYAIKAKSVESKTLPMSILMNLYQEKDVDYQKYVFELIKKNRELVDDINQIIEGRT